MRSIPSPLRTLFFVVVPIFAVLFFVADQFRDNIKFSSQTEELNFYKATSQDKLAAEKALIILGGDHLDYENHVVFLDYYLALNDKNKSLIRNKFERVFDTFLIDFYKDLSVSKEKHLQSIGYYGLARLLLSKREFTEERVLNYINNIDEQFSGINELRGDYYFHIKSLDKAKEYFILELSNHSESNKLKEKLATIYIFKEQYKEAFELIGFDLNVDSSLRSYVAKKNGFLSVIQMVYFNDWKQLFKWSTISSFLILIFWIVFVSLFSKELRKYLLGGIIITLAIFLLMPLVFLVNDGINELFGEITNPFLYHFFCVAFPEELLKLFAVVLIYYLYRKRKQSLNYIDLLALSIFSAAVFAFFENNLYFNQYWDSSIIFGRFVNSSFIHVLCTSTLIVGIFYSRFFKERNRFYRVSLIIVPFLIHAIYNTCLHTFAPLAKVVVIVTFILWVFLLNRIFKVNKAKVLDTDFNIKMSNLVLLSLPSIILIQYVLNFHEFGAVIGWKVMHSTIMNYGVTLFIASVAVLKLNDFKYFRSDVFSKEEEYKVSTLLLKAFDPVSRNSFMDGIQVDIEQKIEDSKERIWYFVKGKDKNYLLRIKDKYVDLDEYKIKMICFEIKENTPEKGFLMKDYTYAGIVLSSPVYGVD